MFMGRSKKRVGRSQRVAGVDDGERQACKDQLQYFLLQHNN